MPFLVDGFILSTDIYIVKLIYDFYSDIEMNNAGFKDF